MKSLRELARVDIRKEAILQILDEGADMTSENIDAVTRDLEEKAGIHEAPITNLREEAIKIILDEGADMTFENIDAVTADLEVTALEAQEKAEPPSKLKGFYDQAMNLLKKRVDRLEKEQPAAGHDEIQMDAGDAPDPVSYQAGIALPVSPDARVLLVLTPIRDQNGFIKQVEVAKA